MTIDEIRIEGEEDGFHLVIHTDDATTLTHYRCAHDHQWSAQTGQHSRTCPVCGTITFSITGVGPIRYRIGLPDQFHAEVQRTIGRWLGEGEAVRGSKAQPVTWRTVNSLDVDESGYDRADPKHPDYHDNISALHDNREGK